MRVWSRFDRFGVRTVTGAPDPTAAMQAERDAMIGLVQQRVFADDAEFARYWDPMGELKKRGTVDFLFATPFDLHSTKNVFNRLRWGGQFVFVSRDKRQVRKLAAIYARKGFAIERGPASFRIGMRIPIVSVEFYYFTARKVLMVRPGEFTERFTYNVFLQAPEQTGGQYVVAKEIPDLDSVVQRLKHRFPEADDEFVTARARQLIETIFPVFLTREAAFLKILQRDLPAEFKRKVPRVVGIEQDDRGYVKKMYLNWLRKAGAPLSQIDFAIQAAELLQQLHERALVIHLDLRLDNIVITEHGVGFVDYGSAARVDEQISKSPFLDKLFQEMMKASQIQRVLAKMSSSGLVTSELLTGSQHKVDKGVDLFFLAVQAARPTNNPDVAELVRFDPKSREAQLIQQLTDEVLRPANPQRPAYRTARDLLAGLKRIRQQLRAGGGAPPKSDAA